MFDNGIGAFFEAGGWGMYPVTLFGLALLTASVVWVRRPRGRAWGPVVALALTTLGAGTLGTVTGFVNTLLYLVRKNPPDLGLTFATGCAESLHNLVWALMFAASAGLLAAIALARRPTIAPTSTPTPTPAPTSTSKATATQPSR